MQEIMDAFAEAKGLPTKLKLGAQLTLVGGYVAIALIISVAVSLLLYGYVLTVLWKWFVGPILHVPDITLAQSAGLWLIYWLFSQRRAEPKKGPSATTTWTERAELFGFVGRPLAILTVGWIIHTYFTTGIVWA